jgi:hypothetical protein
VSLSLREEHVLRVFGNKAMKRIFDPEKDEISCWRMLRNERHKLFPSPNIITRTSQGRLFGKGTQQAWGEEECI